MGKWTNDMKKKIGITIGKFMPFHKGHELLIDVGAGLLDELHVIVSGKMSDEIDVSRRFTWVCCYVGKTHKNVTVHYHEDTSPAYSRVDELGTVLDKEFQNYWTDTFKKMVPDATHFVSSDYYGKVMADLMDLDWIPVDPERETVSISGTTLRKDLLKSFRFLSDVARNHFTKTVAIVGPESTGKSTLTKDLAYYYGSLGAHEYGRTLSTERKNVLSPEDFETIAKTQDILIESIIKKTRSPVVFSDTEAYTTFLFGRHYLGKDFEAIEQRAISQKIDLYLVLAPSVNWIDDGTRVIPEQKTRNKFFTDFVSFLTKNDKNFVIISSGKWNRRFDDAVHSVDQLFQPEL